ncbi:MAG: biotin holocarboxylase synthetase [Cirrosporium novae-zelandiae]|nr:MAG: biotin holocarboxylase synthetase [Cirrosporium novae-zelandiae]
MASRKMNVLVYSGAGTTVESVRHCLYSLRRLLSPHYAVIPINGNMIIKEPWTATCALLIMPGGADLPYCRTLNGEGNRRIIQYVRRGGAYLGFCAGGYYGSKHCEFEVGDKNLEVIGDRELAFFPGTCRGCAFPGFVYHSEEGARAAELKVNKSALSSGTIPDMFKSYYNGGGVFVDASKYQDQGVEILASYTEHLAVDPGEGTAAVVYCKIGDGAAVLTSPHPEFAASNLDRKSDGPEYPKTVDRLAEDDKPRVDFLKACLAKLGLQISEDQNATPSLSRLHLTSLEPSEVKTIIEPLNELITTKDGEEYIKDENDTFHIINSSTWSMGALSNALADKTNEQPIKKVKDEDGKGEGLPDYHAMVKTLVTHDGEYPSSKETPYFNHDAFFGNLEDYQSKSIEDVTSFGKYMMYGEVVTSTNTLLEKNTQILRRLPNGFTATATVQIAGRGRGSNVWISPAGSLIFSVVLRHPVDKLQSAPVVFLQYIAALAIIEGVKSYGKGYENLPVRLKWPNDIYAQDPTNKTSKSFVKIGGILVNSHYSSSQYLSVVGIGINTTNALPTTSLNALLPPHLPRFTLEKLLARFLTTFESLYTRFLRTGFDRSFEEMYYKHWLHMDQIVTLETEGGARARIKGITRDWGLLLAEELGWEDRPTGKVWALQTDSNSFDFFKGLVKRKV